MFVKRHRDGFQSPFLDYREFIEAHSQLQGLCELGPKSSVLVCVYLEKEVATWRLQPWADTWVTCRLIFQEENRRVGHFCQQKMSGQMNIVYSPNSVVFTIYRMTASPSKNRQANGKMANADKYCLLVVSVSCRASLD